MNLFADLKDDKSGKPLSGDKAWDVYNSTLQHIRKNCLSDEPDVHYYVQIGEDSLHARYERLLLISNQLSNGIQAVLILQPSTVASTHPDSVVK